MPGPSYQAVGARVTVWLLCEDYNRFTSTQWDDMTSLPYLIGIDVSTTATKALLIDASGDVQAVASSEYAFDTRRPLWAEQDPALWWDGAVRSIRRVLVESGANAADVAAIGLTGQMHGLVLLDGE